MDGISPENGNTQESLSDRYCNGVFGVPITYLDKYNPEQFEIIGMLQSSTDEQADIQTCAFITAFAKCGKICHTQALREERQTEIRS